MALVSVAVLYYTFNPYGYHFPKCPVNSLTDIKCPSCGSQRAIHFLLHGQVYDAMKENVLSVLCIPYLLFNLYVREQVKKGRLLTLRENLYGRKAIMIILVVITVFTVGRNTIF